MDASFWSPHLSSCTSKRKKAAFWSIPLIVRIRLDALGNVSQARPVPAPKQPLYCCSIKTPTKKKERESRLVGRGVLDDLRAEVGGLDGAEVLLVALEVARVFVQHVRRAGLHLTKSRGGRGGDNNSIACSGFVIL